MTTPRPNGSAHVHLVPREGTNPAPAAGEHPAHWTRPRARLLAIAGGRDGVGRSTLAANLALALGERGARVVLVDGDLGRAHLDLLLGVHPRWDVSHLLSGEATLEEVLLPAGRNVRLLAAAAASPELAELDDIRRETLLRTLGLLDASADWIVLDTAGAAGPQTLAFCRAAHRVFVLCTPEAPAIADAYAFLKRLPRDRTGQAPELVVNMTASPEEAEFTSTRLRTVARRFLQVELDVIASIPEDAAIACSARAQEPVMVAFPSSHAAQAYRDLAARLWKPAPDDPQQDADVDQSQRLEA